VSKKATVGGFKEEAREEKGGKERAKRREELLDNASSENGLIGRSYREGNGNRGGKKKGENKRKSPERGEERNQKRRNLLLHI